MNRIQLAEALDEFWHQHKLPGGPDIQYDNDNQLIIYTGITENDENELIDFDPDMIPSIDVEA